MVFGNTLNFERGVVFIHMHVSTSVCVFVHHDIFSPPRFTHGDLLFFSRNNPVFKSDLLFPPPDSAPFELLMSGFSLPLGSSGNSWPQSGLISMHKALHPAFYSGEFYSF